MNVDDGVESELNRILDSFNWSLLFESFNRVFFFFFSLCVRREVCKIVCQFYHENGKKEREGLHSEKLRAICSGEEIIIQPVTSSYFEMNFPSLFRLQCLLCSFISISLYFHSTENLCHRLWQTCLRFDHDTYQKS